MIDLCSFNKVIFEQMKFCWYEDSENFTVFLLIQIIWANLDRRTILLQLPRLLISISMHIFQLLAYVLNWLITGNLLVTKETN